MNNELIKLIKQERPTGRMGYNSEPVWNAEKVYDLMVKAQQQVKKCDLADVGGSLQPKTCKVVNDNDEEFPCDVTTCCNVGPITRENYCPNCGAKIQRK